MTFGRSQASIYQKVDLPDAPVEVDPSGETIPIASGDHEARSDGSGDGSINSPPVEPPSEADDPYQQEPSRKRGKRGLLARVIRTIRARLTHVPTADEIALKTEKKRLAMLAKELRREAEIFESDMLSAFDVLGLYSVNRKGRKRRVKFAQAWGNADCIYYHVNLRKSPQGATVDKLCDELTLRQLTMHCRHRVSVEYNEKIGVRYRVDRGTSRSGVPSHVIINDVWERVPESADGLTICFGMASNSRPIYRSLASMPHMLVAGSTGAGKSTFLNGVICTLIRRNSSDRLKMLLIDLKRVEFDSYRGVPHLLQIPEIAEHGIVKDREKVADAIRWLLAEVERRFQLLEESGDRKIEFYNQHHRRNALPRIVLIVDEWASIKLEPKLGEEAERVLTQIGEIGRAVGVHLIVATQTPTSQVLSTRIRNVLPGKVAFSCSNIQGSMAILGNGHAVGLYPPGRCIFDYIKVQELQTPNITNEHIDSTVQGVITGKFIETQKRHDVTPAEIMEWSLREENGRLGIQRVFASFRERGIPRDELAEWLDEWEGQEFVVNDLIYRVEPGSGSQPRRLIAVKPDEPPADPLPEAV